MLGGNPRSAVTNGEADFAVTAADLQADPALVGEFDGIAQQIVENLPQPRGIGEQAGRQVGRQLKIKAQALGLGGQPMRRGGLAEEGR